MSDLNDRSKKLTLNLLLVFHKSIVQIWAEKLVSVRLNACELFLLWSFYLAPTVFQKTLRLQVCIPEAHKTPVLALSRYLLLLLLVEMNDIGKSDMFTFYFSWISYLCMELENQSRTYLYDVSLADHRNVFSSIYSWFSPLLSPFQISSFRI